MAGKETVMLYASDLYASLMPDNRRLRGFEKIVLAPDESKTVTFRIKASDLAFMGTGKVDTRGWRIQYRLRRPVGEHPLHGRLYLGRRKYT